MMLTKAMKSNNNHPHHFVLFVVSLGFIDCTNPLGPTKHNRTKLTKSQWQRRLAIFISKRCFYSVSLCKKFFKKLSMAIDYSQIESTTPAIIHFNRKTHDNGFYEPKSSLQGNNQHHQQCCHNERHRQQQKRIRVSKHEWYASCKRQELAYGYRFRWYRKPYNQCRLRIAREKNRKISRHWTSSENQHFASRLHNDNRLLQWRVCLYRLDWHGITLYLKNERLRQNQ